MRFIFLLLAVLASLVSSSAFAASYQRTDGTIVDPILYTAAAGGGPHVNANLPSSPNLEPGAHLRGALLGNANLPDADLSGAYFAYANLTGANLENADLSSAFFYRTFLDGTNLRGTDLSNVRLPDVSGMDLTNTNLSYARIGHDIDGTNFDGANLSQLRVRGLFTGTPAALPISWELRNGLLFGPGVNLESFDQAGADFSFGELNGATLQSLPGADLTGADLTGADLVSAVMNDTQLVNATLVGANLFNAVLNRADFDGADLSNADFRSASLHSIDLSAADLTGATFQGAYYSLNATYLGAPIPDTIFPVGFSPSAAGMIPIPEPGTALLMGLGLTALAVRRGE